jgi:ADP-ribose pyrophosphatase YjhB (NUDIX family)
MDIASGFVIIQNNKILLEHPTGQKWYASYSIPKGLVKEGEKLLDAAIRETKEEIGVNIDISDIISQYPEEIDYRNGLNTYKKIFYYVVVPSKPILLDKNKLQLEEINWAGFLTKEEAEKRIFWRLRPLLKYLK